MMVPSEPIAGRVDDYQNQNASNQPFEVPGPVGVVNCWVVLKELAEYLKIAGRTAYRFATEGKVPVSKVGSAWRFRKSEIDLWIAEQEQKQEGEQK